jgi:hypothetical protein
MYLWTNGRKYGMIAYHIMRKYAVLNFLKIQAALLAKQERRFYLWAN